MRILVIEDDVWISEMLRVGFTAKNYEVTSASNGVAGIELATTQNFDVIVTDVMMPGKTGIEVCKEVRDFNPRIPIIMLTALDSTEDKVIGFDAGADDYLVKPFDFRELLVRIKALTRRRFNEDEVDTLRYADLVIDIPKRNVNRSGKDITLTPREFQLLE